MLPFSILSLETRILEGFEKVLQGIERRTGLNNFLVGELYLLFVLFWWAVAVYSRSEFVDWDIALSVFAIIALPTVLFIMLFERQDEAFRRDPSQFVSKSREGILSKIARLLLLFHFLASVLPKNVMIAIFFFDDLWAVFVSFLVLITFFAAVLSSYLLACVPIRPQN